MDVPEDVQAMELFLLKDLQAISKLSGAFSVEKDAYKFYQDLYMSYEGDFSGRLGGYYERKLTHVLKIAMVLSVSQSNNLIITKDHIEAALVLLSAVEKGLPEAFAYVGAT